MKISCVLQTDLRDCGVSCLMSIIKYYGGYARREYLKELTKTTKDGVSVYSLVSAASSLGFESSAVKSNIKELKNNLPFIAHIMQNNQLGHFVVVYKISNKTISIMDPSYGFKTLSYEEWNKVTTNVYILYKPKNSIIIQNKDESLFKIIINIIKQYKVTIFIITLLSILYTLSEIIISLGFRELIYKEKDYIKYILILLVIIIIFKSLVNIFRNYLINYLNHIFDYTLFNEIYHHIIRLPYLYFKNRLKGDILTRINDTFKIKEIITKLFINISMDLIFIIITLISILFINFKAFIIILITSIIYIILIIIYNNFIIKKIKLLKEKEVLVNNQLIESINSIDTIKSMVIEDMLDLKINNKYYNYLNESFKLHKSFYKEIFLKEILLEISLILIIYLMTIDYYNNKLLTGDLLVLFSLFNYYFTPLNNILALHLDYKEASVAFLRIKELINVKEEKLNVDSKTINKRLLGNIKINNLIYSYNGIDDIIKCQNLEIQKKEKVLLYGNSGGGKSTLMKLLCRYFTNYEGNIYLDERDLKTYNLLDIRNKIMYVSNDDILYSDTVYENIVLDKKINYEKFLEIARICGIDLIVKDSINNYDMFLDNNGAFLSKGQIQRIIIARSLVKDSDIYIFDESFSGIDIKSERKLLLEIFKYLKNKTIIVISHRFNNRDLYQRFIMIKEGIVYEY